MQRVAEALRNVRGAVAPRADFVPASRLAGSELIRLGGGEMVPTPGVPELPLSPPYRSNGIGGDSLALPPANVRVMSGVHIVTGENVVRTPAGAVVGDSVSADRLRSLPRRRRGDTVQARAGRAAPYGAPGAGAFEGLVESLPRALLLQHPALRSLAPISLLHTGGAPPAEAWLIRRLERRAVHVEQVESGSVIRPDTTVVPAMVTRVGAGAIPRWYRRWIDQKVVAAGDGPGPRRLLLVHGSDDPMHSLDGLRDRADEWGFVVLDTSTGHASGVELSDGSGTSGAIWSDADVVAALRDADMVVGASDDALGHAVMCRRAEIVQVGITDTITPRVLQLAESRALPHRFVRSFHLDVVFARPD